jgi:hypothetical protein
MKTWPGVSLLWAFLVLLTLAAGATNFGEDETCYSFAGGTVYPSSSKPEGHQLHTTKAVSELTRSSLLFYPFGRYREPRKRVSNFFSFALKCQIITIISNYCFAFPFTFPFAFAFYSFFFSFPLFFIPVFLS